MVENTVKRFGLLLQNSGLGYSAKEGLTSNTKDGMPAYDLPSVLPVTFGIFTAEKQSQIRFIKMDNRTGI